MSDEAKLDRIGDQLGAVLVQLATVTATVAATRDDLTRTSVDTARGLADHELRLRTLEAHGTAGHGGAIAELQRWRSRAACYQAGYAAGAAAIGGVLGAAAAAGLHLGH